MPIKATHSLQKTGATGSRTVVIPKSWWKGISPRPKKVKWLLDKAGIVSPEGMTEKEIIEHIIHLMGETYDRQTIIDAFERMFDVKIVFEE